MNLQDMIVDQALDDLVDWIDRHLWKPAVIAGVILVGYALWVIARGVR